MSVDRDPQLPSHTELIGIEPMLPLRRRRSVRIEEAVHIFNGYSAAGSGKGAGAVESIIADDCLSAGPCDVDPATHLRKRRAYWAEDAFRFWPPQYVEEGLIGYVLRGLLDPAALAAALSEFSFDRPVVIWSAPSWPDTLFLWWTLDAIERTGQARSRFWIAQPRRDDFCGGFQSVSIFDSADLREAFAGCTPLTAAVCRLGAALWRRFAAPDPRGFDRARRGSVHFPDLRRTAGIYDRFFPDTDAESGRAALSGFDRALLETLRPRAGTTARDVTRNRNLWAYRTQLQTSDLLSRLFAWTAFPAGDPALTVQPTPEDDLFASEFRITPRGRRLLNEGLDRIDDAPPMFVGGTEVYVGDNPWVRRLRAGEWVIERFRK